MNCRSRMHIANSDRLLCILLLLFQCYILVVSLRLSCTIQWSRSSIG